ncbi:DUF500-domain-containing protein [Testicularia cyperi]|uniref:DUF500-domain-containing protein n=1 Tax=Testicularia cyperi TaxID=1882483 RepID=A0A317XL10_9BASI|nr:DUF500-domain-containing protein [Testicularia cyperi]
MELDDGKGCRHVGKVAAAKKETQLGNVGLHATRSFIHIQSPFRPFAISSPPHLLLKFISHLFPSSTLFKQIGLRLSVKSITKHTRVSVHLHRARLLGSIANMSAAGSSSANNNAGSAAGSSSDASESRWKKWGRTAFDKSIVVSDWASGYANGASAKMGGERFWPKSGDFAEEVDKCERILRAFTVEGVQAKKTEESTESTTDAKTGKQTFMTKQRKVLRKIPPQAFKRAKGIVIYTAMRSGIAPFGGAGGAGLMLARLPDGSWSAPSSISPNNLAVGLLLGFDIFDVILLVNTEKAMEAFKSHKVTLGAETAVAAGPFGAGISGEMGLDRTPVYSYVRSRGLYGGVEAMAQAFLHRFDENERIYYWPGVTARDIFEGKVRTPPLVEPLYRALRDAETGIAQGDELERTVYETFKAPPNVAVKQLQQDSSVDILEDGERLKLPPTPEELDAMEAAGIPDEFDIAMEKKLKEEARLKAIKDREEIFALPPPPRHPTVGKYWSNRGSVPGGKRRVAPGLPDSSSIPTGSETSSPLTREMKLDESEEMTLIDLDEKDVSNEQKKPPLPVRRPGAFGEPAPSTDSIADDFHQVALYDNSAPSTDAATDLPAYEAGEASIPLDSEKRQDSSVVAEAEKESAKSEAPVPTIVAEHVDVVQPTQQSSDKDEQSSIRSVSPNPIASDGPGSSQSHQDQQQHGASSDEAMSRTASVSKPSRPPRRPAASRPVPVAPAASDATSENAGATAAEVVASTGPSIVTTASSKLTIFIDWDETISAADTLALIAPPAGSQLHGPDFAHYAEAYLSDMDKFATSFGSRDTLADQMRYLEELDQVERASVARVQKGGLFKDASLESVLDRASQVETRPGWKVAHEWMDDLAKHDRLDSYIVSVGWSARFIRRAIEHSLGHTGEGDNVELRVPAKIYANDLEVVDGKATGIMTKSVDVQQTKSIPIEGEDNTADVQGGIRTGIHKRDIVRSLLSSNPDSVPQETSDDAKTTATAPEKLSVYIGDSNTDLPSLLEAKYGILMGSNASLLETIDRVGLSHKLTSLDQFDPANDASGESTLIPVEDWNQALEVLKKIHGAHTSVE